MHILIRVSGSPAVVIVPALGANVLEWVRVVRAAAAVTPRAPTTARASGSLSSSRVESSQR